MASSYVTDGISDPFLASFNHTPTDLLCCLASQAAHFFLLAKGKIGISVDLITGLYALLFLCLACIFAIDPGASFHVAATSIPNAGFWASSTLRIFTCRSRFPSPTSKCLESGRFTPKKKPKSTYRLWGAM